MTEPTQSQNTLLRSVRDQAKAWINRVRVGRAQFASGLPQNSVGIGVLSTIKEGKEVVDAEFSTGAIELAALCHDAPALLLGQFTRVGGEPLAPVFVSPFIGLASGANVFGYAPTVVSAAPGVPAVWTLGDAGAERQVSAFPLQVSSTQVEPLRYYTVAVGYLCNTPVVNGRVVSSYGQLATPASPDYSSIWLRDSDLTTAMIDDGYEFTLGSTRYRIIGLWGFSSRTP